MCNVNKIRGFNTIELIIVMTTLAILMLISSPKFKGKLEKARLINIQNDVKVAEGVASNILSTNNKLPNDWHYVDNDMLKSLPTEEKLYGIRGLVNSINDGEVSTNA